MRQIKFRVWDKIEKKYKKVKGRDGELVFYVSDSSKLFSLLWLFDKTNRFIIQQFTGFLDKNGVEVYEGDIIGGESEQVYFISGAKTGEKRQVKHEIIWDEKTGAWGKREIGEERIWPGIKVYLDFHPVIGHINQ